MINSIIGNIQDAVQKKKSYEEWIKNIEVSYEHMLNNIDDFYEAKESFSPEISSIYVSKLMDFYSKLRELYLIYISNKDLLTDEQNKHNYDVIDNEVHILLNKYKDFVVTLYAIGDLEEYKDMNISPNIDLFDRYI